MFVMRPVQSQDIDALEHFADSAALGMTSLPKNRKLLKKKIAFASECFAKEVKKPQDEIYCFVLENSETGEVGGCCAIYAKTGTKAPIWCYQIKTSYPSSNTLPAPEKITILKPKKLTHGPAELSMLFLQQDWRKENLGELLSLSRFLFVAEHPYRIDKFICARLRGIINKKKETSPFWEGISRHFFSFGFKDICTLLEQENLFIEEFIPKHPIYVNLLNKQTQRTIGQTHKTTHAAMRMLKKEGFSLTSDIDLFDGGPILQAEISEVHAIKNNRRLPVKEITLKTIDSPLYLVSNTRMDYRCCFAHLHFPDQHTVNLTVQTAEALQITPGDYIRFLRL